MVSPAHEPRVLRQAAQWLVRLDADDSAAGRQAFEAWLAEDAAHRRAVDSLRGSLAPLASLPGAPAYSALKQALPPRTGGSTAKALVIATLLLIPLGLGLRYAPLSHPLADLRSGAGQWRTETLADGSSVTLAPGSALDLTFDAGQRVVHLLRGDILVKVAKDAARPFVVETEHGRIRALGTRFVVERNAASTHLEMIESSTQVQSAGRSEIVQAGQQVSLTAEGIGAVQPMDTAQLENAWQTHRLVIDRESLPDVLERLGRNRRGLLWFDTQALRHLQVTAVLPADDSDAALALLARSLPLEIRHYGPWLTRVSLRQP